MKNDPVYPVYIDEVVRCDGLTKREYFTGMAMQGMLGIINGLPHIADDRSYIAKLAVEQADALIAELAKEMEDGK